MKFTRHTDYALRLLIHLAEMDAPMTSIADVAEAQAISRTHLMKIANTLARAGFVEAQRGRNGGIRLATPPEEINLGAVVRATDPSCNPVDCTGCRLISKCRLPRILGEATHAFNEVLDAYTLADVLTGPMRLPPEAAPDTERAST